MITSDEELLELLKSKGNAPFDTLKYNPEGQKDIQDVFDALRLIVEMENPPDIGTVSGFEDAINHGRNQMLAEIKQTIKKELT